MDECFSGFYRCFAQMLGKSDFGASVRRLNADLVIHSTLNPSFATEISFGCLNRNVTE